MRVPVDRHHGLSEIERSPFRESDDYAFHRSGATLSSRGTSVAHSFGSQQALTLVCNVAICWIIIIFIIIIFIIFFFIFIILFLPCRPLLHHIHSKMWFWCLNFCARIVVIRPSAKYCITLCNNFTAAFVWYNNYAAQNWARRAWNAPLSRKRRALAFYLLAIFHSNCIL